MDARTRAAARKLHLAARAFIEAWQRTIEGMDDDMLIELATKEDGLHSAAIAFADARKKEPTP